MAFPEKTKWLKNPKGWEDLGEVKEGSSVIACHTFCKTVVHIGKENGDLFMFCPMCMIKTIYENKKGLSS